MTIEETSQFSAGHIVLSERSRTGMMGHVWSTDFNGWQEEHGNIQCRTDIG